MANPTIQFKRGQAANVGLASFKSGEPGFTTDKYDFYIGVDGTHTNQKFFGSSRYWEREDGTSAAQLKFVDKDGSNSINFQAPNTLSGIATWILPAYNAGASDEFLKISSASNNQITLDWASVPSGSFTIAADSGSDDTFSGGQTLTFSGGEGVDTTVSDNTISIAAEDATETNKGIASFDGTDFTVTSGDVALNAERVQDIAGAMFGSNTETRITATYQDDDGTIDLVVDNDLANYDNSTSAFITASSTHTLTNKTFDANGTSNSLSNVEVADFAATAIVIESEGIGSNDNDTTIPTSAAVKDYVDTTVGAVDVTTSLAGDSGTGSVSTSQTLTIAGTSNEVETSASGQTVTIGLPNDVTIGQDLTVTRNLYVNGSTTQINVDTLTVDDPLISTGTVSSAAPSSDLAKDLGILMNYYTGGAAKLASVYWDNSEARMVMASVVTESSNVLTATTRATVEIGSLMLSDGAGTGESVITVSGSDRVLQNILVDGGSF